MKQSLQGLWKLQIALGAFPVLIYPVIHLCVYSTSMSLPRVVDGSENTDMGNMASMLKGLPGESGIR